MGKQNRGKFQCIAVPSRSTASAAAAAAAAAPAVASSARPVSSAMPIDPLTGKSSMPWYGKEWSSNKLGIKPKCETPSFEELAARFPGIHEADETQRQLFAPADDDMVDEEDAAPKKPTTSLSRGTPSRASRANTRTSTPAPSAPGSPTMRAADGHMEDNFALVATPSRISVSGATWKTPNSALSTPSHLLVVSGNKSKTLRKSWNMKREQRDAAADAREKQRRLAEAATEERREAARKIAQKLAYKKEQEAKNQQVQVITDTRKIKKMSRKQLRSITKMDVAMANKGPAVTSKTLSRGTVPKGQ